jgi:hypothetical protein
MCISPVICIYPYKIYWQKLSRLQLSSPSFRAIVDTCQHAVALDIIVPRHRLIVTLRRPSSLLVNGTRCRFVGSPHPESHGPLLSYVAALDVVIDSSFEIQHSQ